MALGLSFGKKKQKVDQTTTSDQTQTQQGTTQQAQTQTSQTQSSGTSSTQQQSAAESLTRGNTKGTTTGQEQQVGTTSLFSDAVLQALTQAGLGALGGAAGEGVDTSGLGVDQDQFVTDAVSRAAAAAGQQRGIAEGGLFDSIGGTAGGNTMAALLAQQLATQEEAAVAGARNEATIAAQGINRGAIETRLSAQGQQQGFAAQLLNLLRGGQTTQAQTTTQAQQTAQQQEQLGQEVGSQQTAQQTAESQSQVSNLISLIQQLVSSQSSGTERVKGTTSQSGGGISLGL